MRVRESGFSLLEAIVAMVIVATTLSGLFTWINTDLISLQRAEAVARTAVVMEEAKRRLQAEDLLARESGSFELGDYQVSWRATPIEPTTPGRGSRGPIGLYDHTLFDVAVAIESQSRLLRDFTLRQHRFVKARELDFE